MGWIICGVCPQVQFYPLAWLCTWWSCVPTQLHMPDTTTTGLTSDMAQCGHILWAKSNHTLASPFTLHTGLAPYDWIQIWNDPVYQSNCIVAWSSMQGHIWLERPQGFGNLLAGEQKWTPNFQTHGKPWEPDRVSVHRVGKIELPINKFWSKYKNINILMAILKSIWT